MLVDANILLFARDDTSPRNERARGWLSERLTGVRRVALPWASLLAFVRVATSARVYAQPLTPSEAWEQVAEWLAAPPAWIPSPTERHAEVLGGLVTRYDLRGNLVSDAHLAALAIEHGIEVCSADTDFARFSEIRWVNPLA